MSSSSKSDIKSKKQKSHKNRKSKDAKSEPIIQISSEEQQLDAQPIQKRRIKAVEVNQSPTKINSFRSQRFTKLTYKPIEVQNQQQIRIVECINDEPMKHSDARALITYRIDGNEGTKYVSDVYLHQRVQKILTDKTEPQSVEIEPIESFKEQNKLSDQQMEEQQKETWERPLRYFDIIDEVQQEKRLIKCFRCGKRGHIAKNCIFEQQKDKCMYCLEDHHHHDCNSRACFRCNQIGHVAQECTTVGMECHRCRKKGHVQRNCGTIIFLDYNKFNSDRQFRDRFAPDDLKKLRCLNGCKVPYGHFNCFEYSQKSRPYPRTSKILTQDNPMNTEERRDKNWKRSSHREDDHYGYYEEARQNRKNHHHRFQRQQQEIYFNRNQKSNQHRDRRRQNKMF